MFPETSRSCSITVSVSSLVLREGTGSWAPAVRPELPVRPHSQPGTRAPSARQVRTLSAGPAPRQAVACTWNQPHACQLSAEREAGAAFPRRNTPPDWSLCPVWQILTCTLLGLVGDCFGVWGAVSVCPAPLCWVLEEIRALPRGLMNPRRG